MTQKTHVFLITALLVAAQLYSMEDSSSGNHTSTTESSGLTLDMKNLKYVSNELCPEKYHIPIPVIDNGDSRYIDFYDPTMSIDQKQNTLTLTEYIDGKAYDRIIKIPNVSGQENESGRVWGILDRFRSIKKISDKSTESYVAPSYLWFGPNGHMFYDWNNNKIQSAYQKDDIEVKQEGNVANFNKKGEGEKSFFYRGLWAAYQSEFERFNNQQNARNTLKKTATLCAFDEDLLGQILKKEVPKDFTNKAGCYPLPIKNNKIVL